LIKLDIANELMLVHPCSKTAALAIVDALTDRMKEALLCGVRIEIRGFGVFEAKTRKKGFGRIIKTGQNVRIPDGRSIRFRLGKSFVGDAKQHEPLEAAQPADHGDNPKTELT